MERKNAIKAEVRAFAVEELLSDFESRNLYVSRKLAAGKELSYLECLKQALISGDAKSFAQALNQQNCLTADALAAKNSAETLAYNEFKRYYIRGVCLLAIEQRKLLQVYQAKVSENPSKDANQYVGKVINPEQMLAVARICPGSKLENFTGTECRILRPNSSLCVEIICTQEEVTTDKGDENNG